MKHKIGVCICMLLSMAVAEIGKITFSFLDDDADKVYFDGDDFEISITNSRFAEIPDFAPLTIETVLFLSESRDDYIDVDLLSNKKVGSIEADSLTLSGNVVFPDTAGVIGVRIIAGSPVDMTIGPIPVIDSALLEPGSDYGMAITGVAVPEGDVVETPSFADVEHLFDTPDSIVFVRDDMGSITFPPGINIIDHREQLHWLPDALNIEVDGENRDFFVEIDPASADFLAEESAVVTLHNIPFTEAVVRRSSFGEAAHEESPEDERATTTLQIAEETAVFEVDGFSRYSLMDTRTDRIREDFVDSPSRDISLAYHGGTNALTVRVPEALRGTVQLFTLRGELVYESDENISFQQGKTTLLLEDTVLPRGQYLGVFSGISAGGQSRRSTQTIPHIP
ncbi:hypothetical protein [Chitinivibrio alkaliphilus]|nr:hypothetical protein [Chitinivibrio alkaliphilus]